MIKFEAHEATLDTIDTIHNKYEPASTEYKAILSFNGLLIRLVRKKTQAEVDVIKTCIKDHQDNPTLHADLKEIARLFIGMIEEMIQDVRAEGGEGASPTLTTEPHHV